MNNSIDEDNTVLKRLDEDVEDTENSYISKMTYDKLVELFNTLPPSYRDVCELFYVENMTVAQISEALNMPKGTIKSNLHRMRKMFKSNLKLLEAC